MKKVFFYLCAHFGGHFFIPRGCFPVISRRSDIHVGAADAAPGSTAINFGSIDINVGSADIDPRPTGKDFCCTEIASASTDGHFGSSEMVARLLNIDFGSAVLNSVSAMVGLNYFNELVRKRLCCLIILHERRQ